MKFQSLSLFIFMALIFANSETTPLGDLEEYGIFGRLTQFYKIIVDSALTLMQLNKRSVAEDVTFWCANRENPAFQQVFISYSRGNIFDRRIIRNYFNATTTKHGRHMVAFLVHGYLESFQRNWIRKTADDYLKYVGGNICAVDWNYMALLEYTMSARRTEIVGNYIADFIIEMLRTTSVRMDDITLIGFSMGAHATGVAGRRLNGELPLIIGLDPAGFSFTKYPLVPLAKRLDPSDARFVQVIHTDKNYIGSDVDCGHTDYYPNNGENFQPGCSEAFINTYGFDIGITCSHLRAALLFRASLNPANKFKATRCGNWQSYLQFRCLGNERDTIGLYANNNLRGRLYFATSARAPFVF